MGRACGLYIFHIKVCLEGLRVGKAWGLHTCHTRVCGGHGGRQGAGGGKVGGWGSGREASSNEHFTESLLSCFRMGKQEQGGGGLSRSPLELTTGRKHWMKIGSSLGI